MADSPTAVTATKVTAPRPPSRHLQRARLLETLDGTVAAGRGVVLVSAPAGSGKSTLVNGWLETQAAGVGWLQIDEADDDPSRFWAYVAAALADTMPGLADAVRTALRSGADTAVATVINQIADHAGAVVLVIDDYHLITSEAVHHSVEQLVTRRPENLTVVLSTRIDPPFRLGRLRVRDQLTEVRADDLRFDQAEASWLLDAAATGLRSETVTVLHERTEGWAAGLVLAGLSMRDGVDVDGFVEAFRGDDHLVADYLTDEFLDSVDDIERQRLLDVSVLGRLSGPLIDDVCGVDDGTEWLARLAASNQLVIALDRTGTWFRFHHLLRDLLRLDAVRTIPERLPGLHLAAAAWHRDHGDMYTAIEHYIDGGDLATAGDLIAVHATALLNDGQIFTVLRLLDRLGDLPERHSRSALVRGWINLSTGRFAGARHYYDVAVEYGDGRDANLTSSLGIMVHLAEGALGDALTIAGGMAEPTESTQAIGLVAAHTWAGMFDEARRHVAVARELGAAEPSDYALTMAPGYAAVIELESGNRAVAAEHAAASVEHAERHGVAESPQLSMAHAVAARTTADPDQRTAAADRAIELARRAPDPFTLGYVLALVGDAACDDDDPAGPELLREARQTIDRCPDPGIVGAALARIEARHGLAARAPAPTGLVEEITERELAVLRYLPSQLSQREIANELYVSLNTVKTHCKAIYRKLGVDGRKAAVHSARSHGLL